MITTIIIYIINWLIGFLGSILPVLNLNLSEAIEGLKSYIILASSINEWFPVQEILTCFGVWLSFEIGIWTFILIRSFIRLFKRID